MCTIKLGINCLNLMLNIKADMMMMMMIYTLPAAWLCCPDPFFFFLSFLSLGLASCSRRLCIWLCASLFWPFWLELEENGLRFFPLRLESMRDRKSLADGDEESSTSEGSRSNEPVLWNCEESSDVVEGDRFFLNSCR